MKLASELIYLHKIGAAVVEIRVDVLNVVEVIVELVVATVVLGHWYNIIFTYHLLVLVL